MSSPRRLKICFNCGTPLDETNTTVDHIPPKCLFEGYGVQHKTNRKTVPCCKKCNEEFSGIDKLFRNVIGFAFDNDDANKEQLIKKAVASLLEKGAVQRDSDGSFSITVPEAAMNKFLKRIFKAIYFDTYNEVFPEDDYEVIVINEHSPQNIIQLGLVIDQFIEKDGIKGVSGSPDVFQYIVSRMNFDSGDELTVAKNIDEAELVGSRMVFNENYAAVVICLKKSGKLFKSLQAKNRNFGCLAIFIPLLYLFS